ncbi:hypothetical protein BD779DRAFT_1556550 [Infundibulicybe gibba]|nr:hypothetical protein BD779DRAFT_1556550 [Infundibulicybe gibba]
MVVTRTPQTLDVSSIPSPCPLKSIAKRLGWMGSAFFKSKRGRLGEEQTGHGERSAHNFWKPQPWEGKRHVGTADRADLEIKREPFYPTSLEKHKKSDADIPRGKRKSSPRPLQVSRACVIEFM